MKCSLVCLITPLLSLLSCNYSVENTATAPVDSLAVSPQKSPVIARVYNTAENTNLRLTEGSSLTFQPATQPLETEIAVFVNPEKTFQSYLGIGGAITDASAEVFSKLSEDKQQELLNAYFSDAGINYNIIRTSIHSSDFGLGSHTYIEEGDKSLASFSIAKDKEKRIPMIKRAASIIDNDLVFYASPWSPPAFMKTNNHMLRGGSLLPEYRQTWADYFVKFIEAYEAEGIPCLGSDHSKRTHGHAALGVLYILR